MILYSTVRSTLSHASDKGSRKCYPCFFQACSGRFRASRWLVLQRPHRYTLNKINQYVWIGSEHCIKSYIYIYTQIKSNKSLPLRNIIYTLHDITWYHTELWASQGKPWKRSVVLELNAMPKPSPLGASSLKEGKEQNRGVLPIKNWRFTIKNGDWTIKNIQILEFKYQDEGFNHEGISPEIGIFTWTDEY